jgi:4-hydroxy-tetrahydrodipicolinate synthase
MFIETNPVPVKYAMSLMGLIAEEYRLPLVPASEANKKIIRETLQSCGLLNAREKSQSKKEAVSSRK